MNYPSPYATGTCLPRRNYGPTAAEPKVEAKSAAPLKPTLPAVKLPEPTSKPVVAREACCLEKGVPRMCLGICMNDCTETPDETYRLVNSDNVCNKHEPTAKECCEKEKEPETEEKLLSRSGIAVRW